MIKESEFSRIAGTCQIQHLQPGQYFVWLEPPMQYRGGRIQDAWSARGLTHLKLTSVAQLPAPNHSRYPPNFDDAENWYVGPSTELVLISSQITDWMEQDYAGSELAASVVARYGNQARERFNEIYLTRDYGGTKGEAAIKVLEEFKARADKGD